MHVCIRLYVHASSTTSVGEVGEVDCQVWTYLLAVSSLCIFQVPWNADFCSLSQLPFRFPFETCGSVYVPVLGPFRAFRLSLVTKPFVGLGVPVESTRPAFLAGTQEK